MCLPPQFGLEPTVHQTMPRQAKLQYPQHHHQPQQVQQQAPIEIANAVVCKPDPFQYQVQQPVSFDFQTFDPLNAFDFNTNFILPCDDEALFNTANASCDDVLAPTWPLTTLEDLILPGVQIGENLEDQPQLFSNEDLSSFFSDSSSNKSFAAMSPSFSSSDSGFVPLPNSMSSPQDIKPSVNANGKKRKTRKRRLACDLNPSELARTREVNRIAAQRHRKLLKVKRSEQETKYAELCRKNTELRDTLRTLTAESRALTRIVVDIFAPKLGMSATQQWDSQQMNSFIPSFSTTQSQVFC